MEVVIAYYTRTGNTQALADLLAEELRTREHSVRLVPIAHGSEPGFFGCLSLASGRREAEIRNPEGELDLSGADLILLGAPVWAGRPAPFVRAFLERAKGLEGKPAGVFVSCNSHPDEAEAFAPAMAEHAASMGLEVRAHLTASRKDRARHRDMACAFLDELIPRGPQAP